MASHRNALRSRLIGRQRELAEAGSRLDDHGLVNIIGPPGAGKTALARDIVHATNAREIAWVDLRDVAEEATVLARLAESVGWRPGLTFGSRSEATQRLLRAFRQSGRRMLVLDDIDAARKILDALIDEILAESEGSLRILATGRSALSHQGAAVVRLSGLDDRAARALFIERASAIAPPELVEAAQTDDALDPLLTKLDCMPLAIELAASRLVSRTPGELLTELSSSMFHALEPYRDVEGPLWSTLQRSFRALSKQEQRALSLLATTLAQPFGREAAMALLEREAASPPELLDSLIAHSMLSVEREAGPHGRRLFRVLDAVRAYAELQLDETGLDTMSTATARRRFRAWLAQRVSPHISRIETSPQECLAELSFLAPQLIAEAADVDNPDAVAITLNLALDALWARTGPRIEHLQQLERLERALERQSASRPRVLLAISRIHQLSHDYFASQAMIERAIALGEDVGWSVSLRVQAHYYLTRSLAQSMGEPARAKATANKTISMARSAGLSAFEAGATSALGLIALFEGDAREASLHHRRALELVPREDLSRIRPMIIAHDANARLELGEHDEAERLAEMALAQLCEAGDEILAAKTHAQVARMAIAQGSLDRAVHHLDRAAAEADRLADLALRIEERRVRAWLDIKRGRPADARAGLAEARALAAPILTPRLRRELDHVGRLLGQELSIDTRLRLAPEAAGFRLGRNATVDLRRRAAPRRILFALSEAHAALSGYELVDIGWPGERLPHESAEKRVWTAIWTLRKLGLAAVLHHTDGGYRLEPSRIERVPFEEL